MKKNSLFIFYLSFWLIGLFVLAVTGTFISDYFEHSGFFNDHIVKNGYGNYQYTYEEYGARHNWYIALSVCLFCLSVARIAIWSYNYWEEEINS